MTTFSSRPRSACGGTTRRLPTPSYSTIATFRPRRCSATRAPCSARSSVAVARRRSGVSGGAQIDRAGNINSTHIVPPAVSRRLGRGERRCEHRDGERRRRDPHRTTHRRRVQLHHVAGNMAYGRSSPIWSYSKSRTASSCSLPSHPTPPSTRCARSVGWDLRVADPMGALDPTTDAEVHALRRLGSPRLVPARPLTR